MYYNAQATILIVLIDCTWYLFLQIKIFTIEGKFV